MKGKWKENIMKWNENEMEWKENEMKMRIKWNENANENANKMKCYQIVLNIVLNQSNKDYWL